MNAKKILTIVTWTLLVKTQMDPLCAPVYLDLTEMDGTAQVIASLWLWEMLVSLSSFVSFVRFFLVGLFVCSFVLIKQLPLPNIFWPMKDNENP